jgi:hypothetical protein
MNSNASEDLASEAKASEAKTKSNTKSNVRCKYLSPRAVIGFERNQKVVESW